LCALLRRPLGGAFDLLLRAFRGFIQGQSGIGNGEMVSALGCSRRSESDGSSHPGFLKRKIGSNSMQTQTASRKSIRHEDIAVRAYQIWEAAGRPDGCELQHWLQAEKELGPSPPFKQNTNAATAAKPFPKPPVQLQHEEDGGTGKRQAGRVSVPSRGGRQPADVGA
jgi:hypothetical protein